MFLRDAWYVAARDEDLTRQLTAVHMLGERIVLYRSSAGEPVALEDACPHRKLPLSMGRLVGDEIECGYHGLTFNRHGACTRIPGTKNLTRAVAVKHYPAVSRYGLVWVWMGDPDAADARRIVEVEHWSDPNWDKNRGGDMTVECNYLYVTDNLLDPSHVAWVHRDSFGNEACEEGAVEVRESETGVTALRWTRDTEVPPFYRDLVPFAGRCDRLQQYEVRFPSHAVIKAVFLPGGRSGDWPGNPADALIMDSYNFMTPIDAHRTRYYWFQVRNCRVGDARVSSAMDESVRAAFAEDQLILAAVQRGFDEQKTRHIDLATDRAPLLFRRRLNELIGASFPRGSAE